MATSKSLIPVERIEKSILLIRGHKVMLDSDLAELYGVTTARLNEQVRRNKERFPKDFGFQLTQKLDVVAAVNCPGPLLNMAFLCSQVFCGANGLFR